MVRFEKVARLVDADFNLPKRKTANSAGYDFEVAEDITIPPYDLLSFRLGEEIYDEYNDSGIDLVALSAATKKTKAKPTLVSTGVKCYMEENQYLELMARSSTPLKYWLIVANAPGIVDADYVDNVDNEGEIFFQLINLSPVPINLHRGDIIGQGIIKSYEKIEDDTSNEKREGGFGSTNE